MEKLKKKRILVFVLSALLVVSAATLAGTLLYRFFFEKPHITSESSGNIIASDTVADDDEQNAPVSTEPESIDNNPEQSFQQAKDDTTNGSTGAAKELPLFAGHSKENAPFYCVNWFPGDSETRKYSINTTFHGEATVHFSIKIASGSEKLAEVLKVRVSLPESGKLLYDGLMRDIPPQLDTPLFSSEKTTTSLNYEITPYLETSVGNDYMEKQLSSDFLWWATDENNLDAPDTSDSHLVLFLFIAIIFLAALVFLCVLRKRRASK